MRVIERWRSRPAPLLLPRRRRRLAVAHVNELAVFQLWEQPADGAPPGSGDGPAGSGPGGRRDGGPASPGSPPGSPPGAAAEDRRSSNLFASTSTDAFTALTWCSFDRAPPSEPSPGLLHPGGPGGVGGRGAGAGSGGPESGEGPGLFNELSRLAVGGGGEGRTAGLGRGACCCLLAGTSGGHLEVRGPTSGLSLFLGVGLSNFRVRVKGLGVSNF